MRQFLIHTTLFGLPFLGLLLWLYWAPFPAKDRYNEIQKDCQTGMWLYERIHENPKPIDIAFIGTSRTMCGIIDTLVRDTLHARTGHPHMPANMGVCRNGVNLHALILRDLLAHKHPQYVVVEVHTRMPINSHVHFPMLANAADVLLPASALNSGYFEDLTTMTWTRLTHWRDRTLGIKRVYPEILPDPDFSFLKVPEDVVADSLEMVKKRERRQKTGSDYPTGLEGWWRSIQDQHPSTYYRRMAAMCQAARVPLFFLYLPGYGTSAAKPQEMEFYQTLAPVLLPPDSIFLNPELFFDPDHLNQQGAHLLSTWLSHALAEIMPPSGQN